MPGVLHLRERLVQERVPVPHADVDGQSEALLRERASERVGLAARQIVQRRASADQLVVVRHLLEPFRRNAPSRRDDLEERANVLGSLGSSERDQQDRVDAGHRDDSSWTMSTRAMTWSTGVSLWTPWPRLKTWPGRPPPRRGSVWPRGGSPRARQENGGVEVALHRHVVAQVLPRGADLHAPVEANHVAPASFIRGKSVAVPVPKWMTGTPGTSPRIARCEYGSTCSR